MKRCEKIKAKNCVSSIPQELHIINGDNRCISSKRNALHIIKPTYMHTSCDEIQHGYAVLMIYTLTRDDIPSLSAWIKKFQVRRLGIFWPAQRDFVPVLPHLSPRFARCPVGENSLTDSSPFVCFADISPTLWGNLPRTVFFRFAPSLFESLLVTAETKKENTDLRSAFSFFCERAV